MDDFSKSTVSEAVEHWFSFKFDGNVKESVIGCHHLHCQN